MFISNISVDDDAQSFETLGKKYGINAPGAHILLGYDDDQLFKTPIINRHGVTAPIAHILLSNYDLYSFETPPKKKTTVSLHQVLILC